MKIFFIVLLYMGEKECSECDEYFDDGGFSWKTLCKQCYLNNQPKVHRFCEKCKQGFYGYKWATTCVTCWIAQQRKKKSNSP